MTVLVLCMSTTYVLCVFSSAPINTKYILFNYIQVIVRIWGLLNLYSRKVAYALTFVHYLTK